MSDRDGARLSDDPNGVVKGECDHTDGPKWARRPPRLVEHATSRRVPDMPTNRLGAATVGACALVVAIVATACVSGPLPPPGPPDPALTSRRYVQHEYFLD